MIQTTPLSQRDPRWKLKKLGNGSGTIGLFGCTLTAITCGINAFGANLGVDEANEKLKAVGGFGGSSKNLIIWSKLPKAFPQIKSIGIPEAYNNDKAKAMLDKGFPVTVKVNGASIGASSHWCLLIGDQKMIDPWTGLVVPTSTYPILKLVVWELQRVNAPPVIDEVAELKRKLEQQKIDFEASENNKKKIFDKALNEKEKVITDLRKKTETGAQTIKELRENVIEYQIERDKAVEISKKAEKKAGTLESSLLNRYTTLWGLLDEANQPVKDESTWDELVAILESMVEYNKNNKIEMAKTTWIADVQRFLIDIDNKIK